MAAKGFNPVEYVASLGIDTNEWQRCHHCCPSMKKMKCYKQSTGGQYELHIYYGRKFFNVFRHNKKVATGVLEIIKETLSQL